LPSRQGHGDLATERELMTDVVNIFILIDGLGWEWIKRSTFLSQIAPYRRPLKTVLGFSAGAIPSILTGRYPEDHGRMAMYRLAEKGESPFRHLKWLCALHPSLVENRYFRHALQAAMQRFGGIRGYFNLYGIPLRYLPLLDVGEKADIYRPGGIPEATSIFDRLEADRILFYSYSYRQGSDQQIVELARKDIAKGEARFFFIYLAQIDAHLHAHANDRNSFEGILTRYETWLNHLYSVAAAHYSKVRFHVFSDHGMAPTRRTIDIEAILGPLELVAPRDYLYLLDSTMARFWFHSDRARSLVTEALARNAPGHWLGEIELVSLRAAFGDRRYGEAIFLLPEGCVIAPSHMGRKAPQGMHGFHPNEAHSYAAILSSEDYSDRPNHITDIYRIMNESV